MKRLVDQPENTPPDPPNLKVNDRAPKVSTDPDSSPGTTSEPERGSR